MSLSLMWTVSFICLIYIKKLKSWKILQTLDTLNLHIYKHTYLVLYCIYFE